MEDTQRAVGKRADKFTKDQDAEPPGTGRDNTVMKNVKEGLKTEVVRKKRAAIRKGKEQNNDNTESNALGATFWMSLTDFLKYFYIMTVSFAKKHYV